MNRSPNRMEAIGEVNDYSADTQFAMSSTTF